VTSETIIELAVAAAERAIATAGIRKQAIDCIIAAGALPHQPIPTNAVLIQRALGLADSGIPAFDVNATCLGFLAALDLAGALISAGRYETVLVTAADMPSHGTDWRNPELKAMFGDGAAAAIVRRSEQSGQGILSIRMETYSEGAKACELRSGGSGLSPHKDLDKFMEGAWFEMDGPLAYRISARYMSGFVERLLGAAGVEMTDIDLVIPHQASAHALHLMRKRLRVPPEKLVDLLSVRGNQVSASIPSMLDHSLSHSLAKTGDTILLIGTAAGITLGGAVVRL
jgi:3-oxoacyl-[acyl-carrier-protein] synthase-3